jgi:Flp pilus assembly pilin Flp
MLFGKGQPWGTFVDVQGMIPRCCVGSETRKRSPVSKLIQQLWSNEQGQDIAEYAVMLAVILVIVVGTIRLIGSNANNVFSQVGSSIQ